MASSNDTLTLKQVLSVIAGTWGLLNTTSTINGVVQPDLVYGKHPVGIITYSISGYMSATLTATEIEWRPLDLTFPYEANQSDAECALVGKHSIGYAGPVSLSDAIPATPTHGQIYHGPLIVANVPEMVGKKEARNYTLYDGGRLLKIGSERDGGHRGELWWERLD